MGELSYLQQITEIANSRYSESVALETLQDLSAKSFLERSGYRILDDGTMIYNQGVVSGANSISGNLAMQTELVEDATTHELSVIADNLAEKSATPTTPKIKKGGLAVEVSPLMMVAGALYGAQLGWENYNEYPEFWTDLSNDVFFNNEKDLLPGIQASELVKGGTLLLRVIEDGGVRGYCEKKQLEKILQKAYDKNAFSTIGTFIPQYDLGVTNVYGGGYSDAMAMSFIDSFVNSYGDFSFSRERIATQLHETITQDANAIIFRRLDSNHIRIYGYKLDNAQVTMTRTNNVDSFTKNSAVGVTPCGWCGVGVDNTGKVNEVNSHPSSYGWEDADCIVNGGDVIISTFGCSYNSPVDGLIHAKNLPTVTDRNNVFSNFPTWLENGFSVPRYNEDTKGNEQVDYLPFPIFDILKEQSKEPNADAQKGDLPQNPTDPLKLPQFLIDILTPSIPLDNGTPSENNDGNTPPLIPPTNNNSSKLFTVYNPSGSNLDSLGAYLWSDSITTLIKELFSNNRMDAIISLHQVYCTPSTTTAHNIILGNLDSGVISPVVNNQYVNIDCGRVYVAEKYGDARDYLNVDCQVYLPFIGFRNVDAHDIINCYLNIKYTVDVYTGSCLAQLIVTKGNITQTLYTFEGNCSVQIPLTGSDRARIIGAIASTVATGIATGGVGAVGMAVGQVASGGAQSSIQRTSGFSGNCGAMAIKKPYVVMTRLKSADAVDYNKIVGNPTNKTVYLRNCNGFTRVKEIHLDSLKCTDEEKRLIYNALKQGIVL